MLEPHQDLLQSLVELAQSLDLIVAQIFNCSSQHITSTV